MRLACVAMLRRAPQVKADQSPAETTEELQSFTVTRAFKKRMNNHEAITPKPPTESSSSEQAAQ